MKKLRIVARAIVINNNKILLVRNKGAEFWYPPGGGWEHDNESIKDCAEREVKEETGYDIEVGHMLWLQELHEADKISFETFWLATIKNINSQTEDGLLSHVDHDQAGVMEEAKWFTQNELENLIVYPKRVLKFMTILQATSTTEDPFLGTFL